jgi:hypothetical protein
MTEIEPATSTATKRRLVIHAGFGKCGSSSIQRALFRNIARLREVGVYLFDKTLNIVQVHEARGMKHRFLISANKKDEYLADKLVQAIASVPGDNGRSLAVLSSESLAGMARLFGGLDEEFDVSMVFYVRPQWQWIPSAWQQWYLKRGAPLNEFVSQCLEIGRPAFRKRIEEWQRVLPTAKVHVRFLISDLLKGKGPAQDFFHLIGLPTEGYEIEDEARNTSLDYALLHVLAKNSYLFSGIHDNRLRDGLRRAMSKKFQTANVRMLSSEQERTIEEFFREENLWLLQHYGDGIDIDQIYSRYFTPPPAGARYSDMKELDLIYRCLGIMLDAIARRGYDGAVKKGAIKEGARRWRKRDNEAADAPSGDFPTRP